MICTCTCAHTMGIRVWVGIWVLATSTCHRVFWTGVLTESTYIKAAALTYVSLYVRVLHHKDTYMYVLYCKTSLYTVGTCVLRLWWECMLCVWGQVDAKLVEEFEQTLQLSKDCYSCVRSCLASYRVLTCVGMPVMFVTDIKTCSFPCYQSLLW